MFSDRKYIIGFIEQGAILKENITEALAVSKINPDGNAWKVFIDRLLLWLGGLALAFSAMFFIAYNWDEIGRFAKFGMVEVLMVIAVITYGKKSETAAGKVSLLVAAILLGVLLALYGQTYQTGADAWQLFFNWALLMLPWAFIGRFAALWIVWIALINISIVLYHQTFQNVFGFMYGDETQILWLLFLFNTLVLFVWELLSKRLNWLSESWTVRLLAVISGTSITWLVLNAIFEEKGSDAIAALVWIAFLASMYWGYRTIKPDLFMLAGSCMSGIIVVVSFAGNHLFDSWDGGEEFLLALLVIGLGSASAFWLKKLHREWHS